MYICSRVIVCIRSPAALQELETQLVKAKEDLTTAGLKLRAMIRAFKENQLYVTPPTAGDSEQGKTYIRVWAVVQKMAKG